MSDLVKRLNAESADPGISEINVSDLLVEAANEIERLEIALDLAEGRLIYQWAQVEAHKIEGTPILDDGTDDFHVASQED